MVELLLKSETKTNISKAVLSARRELVEQFTALPIEVFAKMRHFQPQVGCLNRCSFCSQSAGTTVWQFSERGLMEVIAAIKRASIEKQNLDPNENSPPKGGYITYGRNYKPGVIYSYLDNDPSFYPYLAQFLRSMHDDLGVKTRITTVGYSRHNQILQTMHEEICEKQSDAISSVIFSLTPYTFGWTAAGEKAGSTSRKEFISDFENLLKTYKHLATTKSDRFVRVELKFRPFVRLVDVIDMRMEGHHVIIAHPYLLVSHNTNTELKVTKLSKLEGNSVVLDAPPEIYTMVISDKFSDNHFLIQTITDLTSGKAITTTESVLVESNVKLYLMKNTDGIYYAINPHITEQGFAAKQFYPKTMHRKSSGYIDSERHFLNELVKYKLSKGYSRVDKFDSATWHDVNNVIEAVRTTAFRNGKFNFEVEKYVMAEVVPLLSTYETALKGAGYQAAVFFNKFFTVDTGTICNLGRAFHEFRGIASSSNEPLTPQQERAYGNYSSLALDNKVWRIAPVPIIFGTADPSKIGKNNTFSQSEMAVVEELDLREKEHADKYVTQRFLITLPCGSIETLNLTDSLPRIPGSVPLRKE